MSGTGSKAPAMCAANVTEMLSNMDQAARLIRAVSEKKEIEFGDQFDMRWCAGMLEMWARHIRKIVVAPLGLPPVVAEPTPESEAA